MKTRTKVKAGGNGKGTKKAAAQTQNSHVELL